MPSFIKVSEMLQKSQQGDKCHTDNMVIWSKKYDVVCLPVAKLSYQILRKYFSLLKKLNVAEHRQDGDLSNTHLSEAR